MEQLAVIILAAGLGKRMGSPNPKVISQAGDMTLIEHVLLAVDKLQPQKNIVVIGHKGEMVRTVVENGALSGRYGNNIEFAVQKEMLGTGDAVKATFNLLNDFQGTVLILCGDVPLIKSSTLQDLLKTHQKKQATVTMLTMRVAPDTSYGRIVRDKNDNVEKIVEFKDCSAEEKNITEANSGIYAVDSAFLVPAVNALKNDNAQGEYYLTDIIERAVKEGQTVAALLHEDSLEFQGVNTPADLEIVKKALTK